MPAQDKLSPLFKFLQPAIARHAGTESIAFSISDPLRMATCGRSVFCDAAKHLDPASIQGRAGVGL